MAIKQVNLVDAYYTELESLLTTGKTKYSMPISNYISKNFISLMKKASAESTSEKALVMMDKIVHDT